MKKICNDIKLIDKLIIYLETIMKILRGLTRKIFFNRSKGLIFIGKNAKITHKHNIIIGKNTKFERNCEIQGSDVIILDGVTVWEGSVIAAETVLTKSIPKNSKVIDKKNKNIFNR